MAKQYRVGPGLRALNGVMSALLRAGLGPPGLRLLRTTGRRSGRPRTTPVNPLKHEGARYLVSPYGQRAWVQNVRGNGEAWLRRGREQQVRLEEVDARTAAPVLKHYLAENSITKPYFDVAPDASVDAFEAEAARHPVFRVREV